MRTVLAATQGYLFKFFWLAVASIAGALLGFVFLHQGTNAPLLWPPTAIGIAALFLFGYDLWPALLLSLTGVVFLHSGNLPFGVAVALASTLEALLGAYILKRYIGFNPLINSLRDGFGIIAASVIPTLFSGGIIALSMHYLGMAGTENIQDIWGTVWLGHAVSSLSLTPFLIRWLYRPRFTKTVPELIEGVFVFGSIAAIGYFIFWTTHDSLGLTSLIYVLIFPFIWAALRTGPRGVTLAFVITSLVGVTGVVYGQGELFTSHNPQTTLLLQVLLGALDIIFILFAALVEERKEITNSLEENIVKLEQAIEKTRSDDQAKTNFLAILAHELRNPLAPVVSSIELLKIKGMAGESAELLDTIESHVRTISLLLDDLLDITRITHNKFQLRREHTTLQSALRRSLETVNVFLAARKHRFHMEIPAEDIWLEADPVRLEQIFVNLLNNAAKYTDMGGTITLLCRQEGRFAVVRIKDNGIGIAPEKIGGIFELFGQIGDVVRRPGGLGVGLSLTRRLVELHEGSVEARSRGLGFGSEFIVRLPHIPTQQARPRKRTLATALRLVKEEPLRGMRILVVDDNEPAARALGKLLERGGHQVTFAYDGAHALAFAREFKPDAIILDIGLPDIDGYTLAKQIREEVGTPLRLIAVTGYGQEEDRIKTREAGFDAHLVKPVSIADIEQALR